MYWFVLNKVRETVLGIWGIRVEGGELMKVFLVKFVEELFTLLSFLGCCRKSEDLENYPRWDESLILCSFFEKEKIAGGKKKSSFSLEQYE